MIDIRFPFLITVLAFVAGSSAYAQTKPLSEKIEAIRRNYSMPGIVVGHFQNGALAEAAAAGVRKAGNETAITTEDKLHIGSLTKSMTATLIAMSVEEGKLKWTSTLAELFPEIEVHAKLKSVTLEMLLAHRSGLDKGLGVYGSQIDEAIKVKNVDLSKITASEDRALVFGVVLKNAPTYEPGSIYSYSNIGYVLVGHIIERLTKKNWEEVIQEKLFNPLGMTSCGFGFPGNPKAKIPDQPWGHDLDLVNNLVQTSEDNHVFWGPAGRVHCTLKDLNKYYAIHINGFNGLDSLVKAATFTKLHTPYPGDKYTYGGWFRLEKIWAGGSVLTHSGTNMKNMAYVWLAPKKNSAYFGFTNLGGNKAASAVDAAIGAMIYP